MPAHLSRAWSQQGLQRLWGNLFTAAASSSCLPEGLSCLACSKLPDVSHYSSSSSRMLQNRQVATFATSAASASPSLVTVPPYPARSFKTRLNASNPKKAPNSSSALESSPKHLVLRTVPGIGKAYMERLAQNGIRSVDELADTILEHLQRGNAEVDFTPAVRHLQVLGVKRQDHAQRIVKHITAKFDSELYSRLQEAERLVMQDHGQQVITPPLTLCVEGNISAGKSTFLQYITNDNEELQQQLGVVHEPVETWQRVRGADGSTLNLLDKFYQDPKKYAYTFQNYVFMSRVMQERNSANIEQPVRLMERSVFSDRMVFVRAVNESGWMGDVELAVYDSWFGPILDSNPSLVPDGFIYLRCTPGTCMERLKMRARSEEATLGMDYLEGLHLKHEDWLGAGPGFQELMLEAHKLKPSTRKTTASGVMLPNGLMLPNDVSPLLLDSLYVLDSNKSAPEMHPVLNGVPALVLDCNRDVLRDLDLQRQVQQTVAEYINVMRQRREALRNGGLQAQQLALGRVEGDGSRSSNVKLGAAVPRPQPGAPEGMQQEVIEIVQGAGREEAVRVVPNSSGQLQEHVPVSGALEALHQAAGGSSSSLSTAGML